MSPERRLGRRPRRRESRLSVGTRLPSGRERSFRTRRGRRSGPGRSGTGRARVRSVHPSCVQPLDAGRQREVHRSFTARVTARGSQHATTRPREHDRGRLGYAAAMPRSTINGDFERRPYWHATMPALPDRTNRPLPDAVDVVVVGGGYTGINAARELARQGASVSLLEAETLGFGGSTPNGGIVHPGYKWGPKALIERYGEETGRALYGETLAAYQLVK